MGALLYQVTYPDGTKEQVLNLSAFCAKHGLDQGHMSRVANGKRSHHKGFLARIIDANENSKLDQRIKERNNKIVEACLALTEIPFNQVTETDKNNLIFTLYAIEKVFYANR